MNIQERPYEEEAVGIPGDIRIPEEQVYQYISLESNLYWMIRGSMQQKKQYYMIRRRCMKVIPSLTKDPVIKEQGSLLCSCEAARDVDVEGRPSEGEAVGTRGQQVVLDDAREAGFTS
jgi:hypothetical protein